MKKYEEKYTTFDEICPGTLEGCQLVKGQEATQDIDSMLPESVGPCPLQKSLACPRLTLQLPQNQWLMITQLVCFHFIDTILIATSQNSPPLMYFR